MRLRNVKNAKEIIDSSELVITENVFDNNQKLYIEIGCGKGDFIIEKKIDWVYWTPANQHNNVKERIVKKRIMIKVT